MAKKESTHATHAIFPGSFDPLTNGHIDIIQRGLQVFERLTIGVLFNSEKKSLFSVEERISLIEEELAWAGDRVAVARFSGLLVDFARTVSARVVIRGLRAISDYDYEAQMALMNRNLSPGLETMFLIAREENSYISSSIVKQVAMLGGDISPFVPKGILEAVRRKHSPSSLSKLP